MKLLLLFLFPYFLFAQKDVLVQKKEYTVLYSQEYQQPKELNYKVTCSKQDSIKKKRLSFHKEKAILTADNKDFAKSNYDKGHLYASETAECDTLAYYESYSYLNVAAQNPQLNRGVWKTLEEVERRLKGTIKVIVVVDFPKIKKKEKQGMLIPKGFYKTIYRNDTIVRKYYFPNEKPTSNNLRNYEIH